MVVHHHQEKVYTHGRYNLESHMCYSGLLLSYTLQGRICHMNYARHVFDTIPEPTVFAWNVMMKGYSRMNSPKAGVLMYVEMLMKGFKTDRYTFPLLWKGFTRDVALEFGTELHAHVLKLGFESNVYVQNALIHMYCLCGKIDMARQIFDINTNRDDVAQS
ncbi:hypothetical protein ACFE04_031566 [Oxalis oulophora]